MPENALHAKTPVFESLPLSQYLGKPVFLKMDCFQPAGSYKIRGMGRLAQEAVAMGKTHLIAPSGGNAGYAVAYAGRELGVKVTVVVPSRTGQAVRERIATLGAEVIVHGDVWDESYLFALALAEQVNGICVHAFDHPTIWAGHATMIDEIVEQCPKPDVLILSVGGGGLLCGVVEGLQRHGWHDVKVVTVETEGAASFAKAVAAGELITLPAINSIATTLGAKRVAPRALECTTSHPIIPLTVTDQDAVEAIRHFATDHRVLVEPACAVSLVPVYQKASVLDEAESVLVIVCGGIGISVEKLIEWERDMGL